MKAISLTCVLIAFAALSAPLSCAFAQTDTDASHKGTTCLAMGHSLHTRAAAIGEKVKAFDSAFPDPDSDELKIRQTLGDLQSQLEQMAEALENYFPDATAPSSSEQAGVDSLALKDLLDASAKCVE